jgi:hypothetical protein
MKGSSWSCENSVDLCAEGEEHVFQGKAMLLDRPVTTKASAVDMLNRGIIGCLDDFCVVHSMTRGRYFLLYQAGCKEKALSSLGLDPRDLALVSKRREMAAKGAYVIVLDKSSGCELGAKCELSDRAIIVREIVEGGLVDQWNKANPEEVVGAGDHIFEVNGRQGDAAEVLVTELRKPQQMMVVLFSAMNLEGDTDRNEEVEEAASSSTDTGKTTNSTQAGAATDEQQPGQSSANKESATSSTMPPQVMEFNIVLDKHEGTSLGVSVSPEDAIGHLVVESLVSDGSGLVAAWNEANPEQQVQAQDHFVEINGARGSTEVLIAECKKGGTLNIVVQRKVKEASTPL